MKAATNVAWVFLLGEATSPRWWGQTSKRIPNYAVARYAGLGGGKASGKLTQSALRRRGRPFLISFLNRPPVRFLGARPRFSISGLDGGVEEVGAFVWAEAIEQIADTFAY